LALDALRGLAILTMALSDYIPWGVLPAWMYHAQLPPPTNQFNPAVPGITWVDLVFPFFLFSMGAAIPLAQSRRLDQGEPAWRAALHILHRGLLLGVFAIYIQHVYPFVHPSIGGWEGERASHGIGLLGFALMFPVLTRFPRAWSTATVWVTRVAGWVGVVVLMALLDYPPGPLGERFSLNRSNIIMVVLTNTAVFGSLIWVVSRRSLLPRLAILGLLLAFRLGHDQPGWVKAVWDWSPVPWIYQFRYLQYLFIIIPGTIVGDMLVMWMATGPLADARGSYCESPVADPETSRDREAAVNSRLSGSHCRLTLLAILGAVINLLVLVGLQPGFAPDGRWKTVAGLTVAVVVLCAAGVRLMAGPANAHEKLLKQLVLWGMAWLVMGLAFEPYEGGIRKDHATVSYYFVTTGLAIFLLIALIVAIDLFGWRRWFGLLIDNGQNPMLAYLGIQCLVKPVLVLTGLMPLLEAWMPTPWTGFLRGLLLTLLLAGAVSAFTRLRIVWRA
jgi:predicted acyltransferase